MKEHHKCSSSRDYTRTVYPPFPPGSEPGEQRKEDGFGSQQHDSVRIVEKPPTQCRLQPRGVLSKEGESRKREINRIYLYFSEIFCVEKRAPLTSIYMGKRGRVVPTTRNVVLIH